MSILKLVFCGVVELSRMIVFFNMKSIHRYFNWTGKKIIDVTVLFSVYLLIVVYKVSSDVLFCQIVHNKILF